MTRSIEKPLWGGFGLGFAVLVVIVLVSYQTTRTFIETSRMVAHTQEVLTQLEATLSTIKDAESGLRGYVITGEKHYLEPYEHALAGIEDQLHDLRRLTADNPEQERRVAALDRLITDKLVDLKDIAAVRTINGFELVRQNLLSGRTKKKMDEIRGLVGEMVQSERILLDRRTKEAGERAQRTIATITFGSLLALVVVIVASAIIRRQMLERRRIEEVLQRSEERLRQAIAGGEIGTWHWDTSTNELAWSEICCRLHGLPADAVVTHERFLYTVHPVDRERVHQFLKESLHSRKDYDVEYRTVWPNGTVHWIVSKGHGYYDGIGQPVRMEGIALDVTERKRSADILQAAHDELERRVAERTAELEMAGQSLRRQIRERERSEAALQQSEERYRSLVGAMTSIVWTADAEGRFVSPQPSWAAYTGQSWEEHIGLGWILAWHPEDRDRIRGLGAGSTAEGAPYESEGRIWCAAAREYHYCTTRAVPLRNADGSVREWVGTVTDVDERRRALEALRESEERYRVFTEVSMQAVWMARDDGYITYCNQWWSEYTGLTMQQTEGDGWLSAVHPDHHERIKNLWFAALDRGDQYEVEIPFRRASDGRYRWHLARGVPIRDQGGRVLKWIGIALDIHDRKQAEEALRENQARLVEAQRIGKVGSWEINLLDRSVRWSEETFRILGCDPWSFVPTPESFLALIHPGDRDLVRTVVEEAGRTGSAYYCEHRVVLPDGTERMVAQRAEIVRTEAGTNAAMIGTVQDITERHRAEEAIRRLNAELEERVRQRTAQLEAAYKELEAFSYSVSHDLRAPLRHIDGFADLLERHAGDALDEKGRRYLSTITGSAKQMGCLIDDLLVFSRMGRAEMSQTVVELDPLVQEVLHDLQPDVEGRDIIWKVDPLPSVQADRPLLKQVFVNLIDNALKYTRRTMPARIEIGSKAGDGSEAVIFVRDNGVGFDMKYVGKLFGVFQRLHRPDEFEGTGIGLANVRRIVHRHGGRVWAEGRVDEGATFYVSLPQAAAEIDAPSVRIDDEGAGQVRIR